MAFIDYEPREIDYSTPYKTFLDLNNGDTVYIVNFQELKLEPITIENYKHKNNNYNIHEHNHIEVECKLKDVYNGWIRIFDGNTYINKVSLDYIDTYITTDERIGDIVISLLKSRNNYQWGVFKNIFGNPSSTYIDPSKIKLR